MCGIAGLYSLSDAPLAVNGLVEDFVCSDVAWYDRHEHSQPARLPRAFGTGSDRSCPYDCGLCPEHEQHTCIALVEVTSNCNLRCPMCFAESGPGGDYLDFVTYTRMVDRYVALEGIPDVLQLSGGEPIEARLEYTIQRSRFVSAISLGAYDMCAPPW